MNEIEYCNGCGNHCKMDNLKCGKGRALTAEKSKDNNYQMNEEGCSGKQIINLLRQIGHEIHFNSEEKRGQKRILIMLNEIDLISQAELTKRLNIKPGSASEILKKLESRNLIERIPSQVDNRTTHVKITEEGKKEAQIAKEEQKKFYKGMLKNLSDEEKVTLLEILKKINLKKENGEEVKHHMHHSHHDKHNH